MTLPASPKSLAVACLGFAAALLMAVWFFESSPVQPGAVGLDGTDTIATPARPRGEPRELIALNPEEPGARDAAIQIVESPLEVESRARPKTVAAAMAQPQLVGRVVDQAGQPVAGADCLFSTERDFDGGQALLGTETGFEPSIGDDVIHWVTEAAGEIRVSQRKPTVPGEDLGRRAKVTLGSGKPLAGFIRCPGFVPLRLEGQIVSAFRPHGLGELVMHRGMTISGIVLSLMGEPIPGVRLTLQQPMARGVIVWETPGRGLDLGVTDEEGRFQCAELRGGPFKLIVEAPSASTVVYEGVANARTSATEIKIRVGRGAVLHGRVLDAPEGRRIAIEARSAAGDVPDADARARFSLVSTEDGSFTIHGLTPTNPVWLQAVEAGPFGRRASGDAVREVKPVEAFPGRTDEVLMEWKALSGAHGRVVAPSSKGGGVVPVESFVLSSAPSPIEEHPFPARPLLHRGQIQRHYQGGRFSFDSKDARIAGAAQVNLRIRAAGYEDLELLGVGLSPHTDRDLGDLLLRPAPAVRVKVVDAETGKALSRARVYLASVRWKDEMGFAVGADRPLWGSAKISYGETGGGGIGALSIPPSGAPWLLAVCADGYVPSQPVSIISAADEQLVELHRGATLEVTAVDSTGTSQSGVDVLLAMSEKVGAQASSSNPVGFRARSTTNRDGKVTFYGVPTGGFTLEAIPPVTKVEDKKRFWNAPYYWRSQFVSIVAPERQSVELKVPAFVDFEGLVTVNRLPIAGARVLLEVDDLRRGRVPTPGGPKLQAISDAEGRFRFERIPAHLYRALVSHPTRSMVMPYRLDIKPGMDAPTFPLPQTVIDGRVLLKDSGLPVEGAEVTISAPGLPAAKLGTASRVEGQFGRVESTTAWTRPGTILTDSSGWFEFQGVAPGVTLTLTVKGTEFTTVKTRVKAVGRLTNYREVDVTVNKEPAVTPPRK